MNEFELIDRFFTRPQQPDAFVRQGIGDDCALLACGDRLLAVTTDLLVEHRHFLAGADPEALGHKALAVNLSDLAAAGATPRAFQLALALPRADAHWLAAFSRGLFALADAHGCALVGGDTTRSAQFDLGARQVDGPLTVCITAFGEVPSAAVRGRAGAVVNDDVWVSGHLGDAAAALAWHRGHAPTLSGADLVACRRRMDWPLPRVALGVALRGLVTSAIDLSDGLLGDLGHILRRSQVGATVHVNQLPLSGAVRALPDQLQQRCAVAGGDDYELLFTAAPARRAEIEAAGAASEVAVTRIGRIDSGRDLVLLDGAGHPLELKVRAFDHFTA